MKIQWEILLFIFILNLVVGMVIILQFPGTEYITPTGEVLTAGDYEAHYNYTDITEGWKATPFSGIPMVGDIFAGFNFLVQDIGYLVDGFPTLLTHFRNTYLTSADGQQAFDVIANVLRAVYALLISMFLIEFISGRQVTD